ncbi:glycosyltransferase family 2 protein [Desulfovibrio subterraneus]|uniref:Glycosyltransferase 2-like domain-containing protein n=1 Tax=Desulfovibrio subterraneus TaxID=2718620 RepID=A0A7J0BMX0_9BACT|nr:glycosyltransferase family 2 protein [Desulfovibrio subterraneus]GFM34465.1 hypothetical protein DSM101010T_28300 [Desulfovibrio subterraneus]
MPTSKIPATDRNMADNTAADCSVFIVSYNTREILARCLEHLFASNSGISMEVFIVDNDSKDDSVDMVRERFPQVILMPMDWNMGFARANNAAFARSTGEFVILLNPDAFVEPDAIAQALSFMHEHPKAAACGGLILDDHGGKAPSARRFPTSFAKFCRMWGLADRFSGSPIFDKHDYRNSDLSQPMQVDWVPGTFTVIRRKALADATLFDERFFMYYEETDLCLRLQRQGWEVWFVPSVRVMHLGGASAKTVKKDFDSSGSQVSGWRLRSEYLYFRKNFGLAAVLMHAGIEISRHWVRIFLNSLRKGEEAARKKTDSRRKAQLCQEALADTGYGSVSPKVPW